MARDGPGRLPPWPWGAEPWGPTQRRPSSGPAWGQFVLLDRDLVEETNLHRVALFTPEDIGRPKADAACEALRRIAPEAAVTAQVAYLGSDLAEALVP